MGGGITGLSAAYELERARAQGAAIRVDLYEASAQPGGVIETEEKEGFRLDGGPDSLVKFKPAALELCRELGISDELIPARAETAGVSIYSRGALRPLPLDGGRSPFHRLLMFLGSGLISLPGLIRMAGDLVLPRGPQGGDLSMAEFFGRRLGREAVERIIDPLLAGIYAGDPARLSMRSTFPRFLELVRHHRSLALGMSKGRRRRADGGSAKSDEAVAMFFSFREGVGRMVSVLAAALGATTIREMAPVRGLERREGRYVVRTAAGQADSYSGVLLAVPAPIAATLVRPLVRAAARAMEEIRYTSSATVFLGYRRADLREIPEGHGFLVPQTEDRQINGATWVSNKYPGRAPADRFLARCYVGGDRTPGPLSLNDPDLVRLCGDELATMVGIQAEPLFTRVFRYENSNPQYEVGHAERVAEIELALRAVPGLVVAGAGYRGVGIPDCVKDGRTMARRLLAGVAPA